MLPHAVCSLQFAVCGLQSAVCSLRSVVCSLQSAVCKCHTALEYQEDFLWTENKEVLCFTLSVSSTRSFEWNFGTINTWTNCQFIWSGKGYIWLSVWEFQKLFVWQHCFNKVVHVENWETDQLQHDLYVDISYKFTLAWVFVSHPCTQIKFCEQFQKWLGTL